MKKKILIKGNKVHDGGYRLFLMETADEFGIENFYAKNVKVKDKEAAIALIESENSKVEIFFNFVKENFPQGAVVSSVDSEGYDGNIKPLESFRSAFSASQLSKIAQSGVGMLKKQDQMLEKQDQTINEIKAVGSRVMRSAARRIISQSQHRVISTC